MKNKKNFKWYFLITVLILYLILYTINYQAFNTSILFFVELLKKIIPSLALVFVLLFLIDYFIDANSITKHLKDNSIKKWIYTLIAATFASGPPFLWYPLLKDLNKKGVSYGILACFLYSRSIKIPYLPLLIFYFGIKYTLILSITMMIVSVIQGLIIDKIIKQDKKCQDHV